MQTTYEWDARNQLVAINKGGHRSEFTYDGMGRRVRIKEIENSVTQSDRFYLWDGLTIIASGPWSSAGITGADKKYFGGGFQAGGQSYYYIKDRLGSVRAIVGATSGYVEGALDYDEYGLPYSSAFGAEEDADFLYTGHFYHRPSGLYLAPYRAYDPQFGRWLSREPLGLDGPNLYHYGFSSPTNLIDPMGLEGVPSYWPAPYPNLSPVNYPQNEDYAIDWDDYFYHWNLPGPYGNPNNPGLGLDGWGDPLSFNRAHNGIGTTIGRGAYGVAIGATTLACGVGTAELFTGNASTALLGPAARNGGRLFGIRNPNWWKGKPWHIDYGPIVKNGPRILHLNPPRVGRWWRGAHWPLNPMRWF